MEIFDLYTWVSLPLLVFSARVLDVTLGTLRIISVSRGRKYLAPLLGFVEVFIWITVVSQIVKGTHNLAAYLAYASGFAVGNYVGMWIEEKLAIGTLVLRIVLPESGKTLVDSLREAGFGVTYMDAYGGTGPVMFIYTVVLRKEFARVAGIIEQIAPGSFFTVDELRSVQQGIFPARPMSAQEAFLRRKSR